MAALILLILSLIAFSISSRGLLLALTENIVLKSMTEPYSRQALKISKGYKILAWSMLSLFLFISSLSSFINYFLQLS